MIVHACKHYFKSSADLRTVLDVYVYTAAHALNMDYVRKETEKLGLSAFEEQIRSLSVKAVQTEPLSGVRYLRMRSSKTAHSVWSVQRTENRDYTDI